jgi:hypothetical protein
VIGIPTCRVPSGGNKDDDAVEREHAVAHDLGRADVVDDDERGADEVRFIPGPR